MDATYRVDEFCAEHALKEVSHRACLESARCLYIARVGGEDDDASARELFTNGKNCFNTVHLRHLQIHERDVWSLLPECNDSLPPVCSFTYELHIPLGLERESNTIPDERMIVDTEDPYAIGFVHKAPPEEFSRRYSEKSSREASQGFGRDAESSAKISRFLSEVPPHKGCSTAVFLRVAILDLRPYCTEVQRLCSSYPSGIPGIALVLLRLSVAVLLFAGGDSRSSLVRSSPLFFLSLAVAVALCAGGGTKLAAFLALVVQALLLVRSPQENIVLSAIFMTQSLSAAMLGGGYYSIDGFMYGRKRVIFPPSHR